MGHGKPKGGFTSSTIDGGRIWENANDVGFRINRFRFIGDPVTVGYASGETVYKFTDQISEEKLSELALEEEAAPPATLEGKDKVTIPLNIPEDTLELQVDIWERFGRHVRRFTETNPGDQGLNSIEWDFRDWAGEVAPPGGYIVRITADDDSRSLIVFHTD